MEAAFITYQRQLWCRKGLRLVMSRHVEALRFFALLSRINRLFSYATKEPGSSGIFIQFLIEWRHHCTHPKIFQMYKNIVRFRFSFRNNRLQIFKRMGVKFNEVFLSTEWLQRNFSYFAMILPLDFVEIFNIFRIRVLSAFLRIPEKFSKKVKTITISKLSDSTSNNFHENHC